MGTRSQEHEARSSGKFIHYSRGGATYLSSTVKVPDKLSPSPTQDAKIKYDMDDQEDESQWTQVGKKKKKKQPSQQVRTSFAIDNDKN